MTATLHNTNTSQPLDKPASSDPWIRFDIDQVLKLKGTYEEVVAFILNELPDVNWNSPKAIVNFYKETFDITLPDGKIQTLASILGDFDEESELFEITLGLLFYLRLKYTLHNYILAILRHQENGIVTLRWHDGAWVMPNKRPLSYSQEINQCIIARSQKGF